MNLYAAAPDDPLSFQTGVRIYHMHRQEDDFSRGMRKIRPGLYPVSSYTLAQSEQMNTAGITELYLRIDNLLGEAHSGSVSAGSLMLPVIRSREIRFNKDLFIKGATAAGSEFSANYFMFHYDYRIAFLPGIRRLGPFFSGWQAETGGGFGITGPLIWKMRGTEYAVSPYPDETLTEFRSKQVSKPGPVTELRIGVQNSTFLARHLTVQAGLSIRYIYTGGFSGTVRGSDGTWYFDQSGHLISAGNSQIAFLLNEREALGYTGDPGGSDTYFPAKKAADMHHALTGIYFAAAFVF